MKRSDITVILFFTLLGISLFLFSCVNQRSVARWVEKNGSLVKVDSVFVTDTLTYVTERIELDTIFKTKIGDTIYLEKDRLKIKYVQLPGDSVYIGGISEADTVIQYVDRWVGNNLSIEQPKTLWEEVLSNFYKIFMPLIILIALLAYIRFKKRKHE